MNNHEEFLAKLETALAPMAPLDRDNAMAYYRNLFQNPAEPPETILSKLPAPEDVATDILNSYNNHYNQPTVDQHLVLEKPQRNWLPLIIILICASPILLALGAGIFGGAMGVLVGVVAAGLAFIVTGIGLIVTGLASLGLSIPAFIYDSGFGLLAAGFGFIGIGLGIFFIKLVVLVIRWLFTSVVAITQYIIRRIKNEPTGFR